MRIKFSSSGAIGLQTLAIQFLTLIFAILAVSANVMAQGLCTDPCDLRVPEGYVGYAQFQNYIDTVADINGNGEIEICLDSSTWIGNYYPDEYDNLQYTPLQTIVVSRDNVTITGSSQSPSMIYNSEANAIVPAVNSMRADVLMYVSGARNFKLQNVSLFARSVAQPIPLYIGSGATGVQIENVNFIVGSWGGIGMAVIHNDSSNPQEPEVKFIRNVTVDFNSRQLKPTNFNHFSATGIFVRDAQIGDITKAVFKNIDTFQASEVNNLQGMYIWSSTIGRISDLSATKNSLGGHIGTGFQISHTDIDELSNISGDFNLGMHYFTNRTKELRNVNMTLIPKATSIYEGCTSIGIMGNTSSNFETVGDVTIRGADRKSCGVLIRALSTVPQACSIGRLTNFNFSGSGSALRLKGACTVDEMNNFNLFSMISDFGAVVTLTQGAKILQALNGSISVRSTTNQRWSADASSLACL